MNALVGLGFAAAPSIISWAGDKLKELFGGISKANNSPIGSITKDIGSSLGSLAKDFGGRLYTRGSEVLQNFSRDLVSNIGENVEDVLAGKRSVADAFQNVKENAYQDLGKAYNETVSAGTDMIRDLRSNVISRAQQLLGKRRAPTQLTQEEFENPYEK